MKKQRNMEYGLTKKVNYTFEKAIERITEELKKEGFGILTTIDVKDTLKKKIDVEFHKYIILGACNPNFAYHSLQIEELLGLLLPCNVIVFEKEDSVYVSIMNPEIMAEVTKNPAMTEVARQVKDILTRVLNNI